VPAHDEQEEPIRFDDAQRRRKAEAEAAFARAQKRRQEEAIAKLRHREVRGAPPSVPPPNR
jgi:hypothetical protein